MHYCSDIEHFFYADKKKNSLIPLNVSDGRARSRPQRWADFASFAAPVIAGEAASPSSDPKSLKPGANDRKSLPTILKTAGLERKTILSVNNRFDGKALKIPRAMILGGE